MKAFFLSLALILGLSGSIADGQVEMIKDKKVITYDHGVGG